MMLHTALLGVCLTLALTWMSTVDCGGVDQQQQQQQTRTCSAQIANTKPGSCPAPNPGIRCIWCNDNCRSDNECSGDNKCCPQPGCGNGCREPVPQQTGTCEAQIVSTKPGSCPAPDPNLRCFACNDNCKSDNECSGNSKCCPQPGCGNHCKEPVQQPPRTCGAQIANTKPGSCPAQNPGIRCIWCNDNCRSDNECPDDNKCCPQSGCGNGCQKPVQDERTCNAPITQTKPGSCAPPDNSVACIWCNDNCRSDSDCSGGSKCCSHPGCGNSCQSQGHRNKKSYY